MIKGFTQSNVAAAVKKAGQFRQGGTAAKIEGRKVVSAKKMVLPKALNHDELIITSKPKQGIRNGGRCDSYSPDNTPCGCGDFLCCPN